MKGVDRDPQGNGSWVARWVDPTGRQRKRSFPRKIDAERFKVEVEAAKHRGHDAAPSGGRTTIGEYGEAWMLRGERTGGLKPKSESSKRSLWRSQVKPRWGETRLDKVTYAAVADWVADMVDGGLSASRARQSYHLLTSLLDAAVKARLLAANVASGVDLPRLVLSRQRYLTHAQAQDLAAAAGRHRLLVLALAYTGLRWGEAVALRVRNARLTGKHPTLVVEVTVADVDGHLVEDEPKDHERRAVPVPKFIADDLQEAIKDRGPDDLVFPNTRGTWLRSQNFHRDTFGPAAESIGIPDLDPHELRHTAASLAIAAGADVLMVSRMLGHASAKMTLDRYGHLWTEGLSDIGERLDRAARRERGSS